MKKKGLLITLLFLMFTLTSCLIQDHIMVEVGQGLKNVTENNSYCIETDIYLNNPLFVLLIPIPTFYIHSFFNS